MKAVVFHAIGDIRIEEVSKPELEGEFDAIVKLTASAICGTDLHFIRGTMAGVEPGTVLGHEGVGTVEQVGKGVRNLKIGQRVVVPSTVACGYCAYCRAGYYAQCDNANPNGPAAGTAFFGGPKDAGGLQGMQAEFVRVPFAHVNLVPLPDEVSDDEAILLSDIFPTGYFGADMANIKPGHTVAVFGCGPVGQFAIASAKLLGAGRVIAVDQHEDRLGMAQNQGAEVVDFGKEDPVKAIKALTGGIGVDCAIDAVGVDAEHAHAGTARKSSNEAREASKDARTKGEHFVAGDGPGQALEWAVAALAKAGTLSIIGVYPPTDGMFPIGVAMNKNLTVRMGNCNHLKYVPMLVELVRSGRVDPTAILTEIEPMTHALDAYKAFDARQPGWIKVELSPDG
jgi:threonine dehydrogenase-like Zn-dependent dehydrogenase